jgi:hypothetical protein
MIGSLFFHPGSSDSPLTPAEMQCSVPENIRSGGQRAGEKERVHQD